MSQRPTIEDLQARLRDFRDEREWGGFHTLKDLAAAIAIEAAELQEIFLWGDTEGERERLGTTKRKAAVEAELADVIIHCLNFANVAEIDVPSAVLSKIEANARRYPVEKARGTATKYTEL